MTKTSDLIEALAESATPVRRLRPPIVRAAQWLLLAAIVILLLSVAHGLRPDIELRLYQPIFVVSMASPSTRSKRGDRSSISMFA